jgi:hypothetical protein
MDLHGLLSQISATIQIATTGHSRALRTPIGAFEFRQLKPTMFRQGIERRDAAIPYLLASAEKALLDTLHISTRKARRFARLPEVELGARTFNERTYERLLRATKLPPQIAVAMQAKYGALDGVGRRGAS